MTKAQTKRLQRIIKLARKAWVATQEFDDHAWACRKVATDDELDRLGELEEWMFSCRDTLQDAIVNYGELEEVVLGLIGLQAVPPA